MDEIVKSNKLIQASYRLTIQQQRIVLMIVSMINSKDEDFKTYRINVKDLMNLIKVKGHSKYEEIKAITKKLRERGLSIQEENTLLQVGWVSSIKYFDKEGYLQIRLDPELKPYLLNLKGQFTQYQLRNIIMLKSAYSIRIYELLKQYEKIGERYFELDELKKTLGIEPHKYKLYGHFKNKILTKAQTELKHTDLIFKFKEKKKVRKVIGVHFLIKSKDDAKPLPEVLNLELYERLKGYFCLSAIQARDVLNKYPESRLIKNLAYVERKYKQGGIKKIGAYTMRAIRENYIEQKSLFDEKKITKRDYEGEYKIYRDNEIKKYRKKLSAKQIKRIEESARKKFGQKKSKTGINTFIKIEVEQYLAQKAGVISYDEWRARP